MMMGSGAAMSLTKSHEPFSATWSMIQSQTVRSRSSISRTRLGVKPELTNRRRRTCSGESKSIIIGRGGNFGRTPPAFENDSVSTDAALTAA